MLICNLPLTEVKIRRDVFLSCYSVNATNVGIGNHEGVDFPLIISRHMLYFTSHTGSIYRYIYEMNSFLYSTTIGYLLSTLYIRGWYSGKSLAETCAHKTTVTQIHWQNEASAVCNQTIWRDFDSFTVWTHISCTLILLGTVLIYFLHYTFHVEPFAQMMQNCIIQHNKQVIHEEATGRVQVRTMTHVINRQSNEQEQQQQQQQQQFAIALSSKQKIS